MSAPAIDLRHYRMPAEWEPHRGTILTWPHRQEIWPGVHGEVERTFAELAAQLSEVEEVHVNVPSEAYREHAATLCRLAGANFARLVWHIHDSDDVWARDHGPIFVVRRPQAPTDLPPMVMLDWKFNAWGGKFQSALDDLIPAKMNEYFGVPRVEPGLVMEGGSLEVNGQGDLLTTEAVILHDNRNPGHSRQDLADSLSLHLGCARLHWLGRGLLGDDTDGHIDDIARFVGPATVVVVGAGRPDHPDHQAMRDNIARLQEMRGADGLPWQVVELPVPEPVVWQGEHLPASYANFYIANGKVLVPVFGQATDQQALDVLQALMPDRKVVGIDGRWLVTQYGNVHCVTQQIPAV